MKLLLALALMATTAQAECISTSCLGSGVYASQQFSPNQCVTSTGIWTTCPGGGGGGSAIIPLAPSQTIVKCKMGAGGVIACTDDQGRRVIVTIEMPIDDAVPHKWLRPE